MSGRKRNTIRTRDLNNHSGGRLGRESVHGLQFHHAVAEGANDSPAARRGPGCHRRRAEDDDPLWDGKLRGVQKVEERWQIFECAALRAGKKRQSNDTHRFLGVVRPVAVGHPGGAEQLQFTKGRLDEVRGKRSK